MVFDEWWFKYGLEIDGVEKNDACTIWCAAQNNMKALKPSHNNARAEIYAHTPCGYCVSGINGGWNKCECVNYSEFEGRKLSPVA